MDLLYNLARTVGYPLRRALDVVDEVIRFVVADHCEFGIAAVDVADFTRVCFRAFHYDVAVGVPGVYALFASSEELFVNPLLGCVVAVLGDWGAVFVYLGELALVVVAVCGCA